MTRHLQTLVAWQEPRSCEFYLVVRSGDLNLQPSLRRSEFKGRDGVRAESRSHIPATVSGYTEKTSRQAGPSLSPQHPDAAKAESPQSRREYREPKLARNRHGDEAAYTSLKQHGWKTLWYRNTNSKTPAPS
jgi:hypothetical protein